MVCSCRIAQHQHQLPANVGHIGKRASGCNSQINADNLKDRERWAQGWLQREELDTISTSGPECRRCSGTGRCACHFCAMPGMLIPV